MNKFKFKEHYYYFILSSVFLLYGLMQIFQIGEKVEKTSFSIIKGHIAKPIVYKKETRGSDAYFNITLKEYPAFGFNLSKKDLIRKNHFIIENIKYTTKNELGQLVALVVDTENAKILSQDSLSDYNTPRFWEKGWIHIYALVDKNHVYAKLIWSDHIRDPDQEKVNAFIVCTIMSIICFFAGKHIKKYKRF